MTGINFVAVVVAVLAAFMMSTAWEDVQWKLAPIHAGDWLVKILLMTVILSVWH